MSRMLAIAVGLVAMMVVSVAAVAGARHEPRLDEDSRKVGICHATGSASNPYVFIIVERHAAERGHGHHERDVIGVASEAECPQAQPSGDSPTPEPTSPEECGDHDEDETADDDEEVPGDEDAPEPTQTTEPSPTPTPEEEELVCPADVEVQKDGAQIGMRVAFNLTVRNLGPVRAQNVTLKDDLPDVGRSWSIAGDPGDCTLVGRNLTCDFGALDVNETRLVNVSAARCPFDCGTDVVNTARVSSALDRNASNNEATATIEIEECPAEEEPSPSPTPSEEPSPSPTDEPSPSPSPEPEPETADVSVNKTAVQDDETVEFSLVVSNAGPGVAVGDGVYLNDSLPELGSEWFLGGPDSEACTLVGNEMTCRWEEVPANETRSVLVTGYILGLCGDDIVNTATVWAENDVDASNNEDTAAIDLPDCPAPDAAVGKTVSQNNETATFMIVTSSVGQTDAANVTMVDDFPEIPGAEWFVGGADSEDCALANDTLTCEFGTLPPGTNRTVTATAYIRALCQPVTNTARVSSDVDGNASNDEASADVSPPSPCADASVDKTASQSETAVVFTIVVKALGPEASENVTLLDELPDLGRSWFLGGADSESCAIEGGNLTCAFGDLASGESRTVTVKAYTDGMECGKDVVNTARILSDNDSDRSNDESSANIVARAC